MYNKMLALLMGAFLFVSSLHANEGMWLPFFLKDMNEEEMREMGMELTAEDIYSVNNSSLKDAVVSLGGFCTAEVISSKGLLLTNHHCAYGQIQSHSSVDNDYLTDGFWAATHDDELANPGLSVSFLLEITDVTEEILERVKDAKNESQREQMIQAAIQKMKSENKKDDFHTVEIKSFFKGNEYYMMTYQVFKDIRLVGAPPESIGKYGGDTDNWMWPRHTGDFSLLRIYADKDGNPAEYSEDNIPYTPKHHLPVSLDGVKEGDFAMVMGYPGSTQRFLSSYGVKLALDVEQPARVKVREKKLELMKEDMDASKEVRIQYASKYARVSNYWKYFKGQSRGLKRLNVYDKKVQIEDDFMAWVNEDDGRKEEYGDVIKMLEEGYSKRREFELASVYIQEAGFASEAVMLAMQTMLGVHMGWGEDKKDTKVVEEQKEQLLERAQKFFKDYSLETDKKVTAAMLQMYYDNVDKQYHPKFFEDVKKGDFEKFVEKAYKKSFLTSEEEFREFLEKPKFKTLDKDPIFNMALDMVTLYRNDLQMKSMEVEQNLKPAYRLLVKGLREMNPDKRYYPNANFTMRVSYGQIFDYYPADAVRYDITTTIDGVMDKEDPSNDEFIVPDRLKELYRNRDFGRYADENGDLIVNFISKNDITGGNSGSPVINGRGELIGCAFDGNWEAMSGDIAFEPELQRTISVDARYILFIIDKYAGAKHIVDEMTVIDNRGKKKDEAKAESEDKAMETTN